jgi:tetratricopeptide (TPR) repeat protein
MRLTKRGKRRITILLVALAVAASGVVIGIQVREAARARLLADARETGLAAYRDEDYEVALEKLTYYVSSIKDDVPALVAFADSRSKVPLENRRHLRTAIGYYRTALRVDPRNRAALSGLLGLYEQLRFLPEFESVADRLLALDENHLDALVAKAKCLHQHMQRGDTVNDDRVEQLLSISIRLCELDPENLSWRSMYILAREKQGSSEDDILAKCDAWLREANAGGDEHRALQLLRAQLLYDYGRIEDAKAAAANMSLEGASSRPLLEKSLQLLDLLQMHSDADVLLAATKQRVPDESWVYETAIERHWSAQRLSDAIAGLRHAEAALEHTSTALLRWRLFLYSVVEDRTEARCALRELRSRSEQLAEPERDETLKWAAAAEAWLDKAGTNFADRVAACQAAIALRPDDALLRLFLAELYQRAGEHELAIALLGSTEQLKPQWRALPAMRAESLLALGRSGEAFEAMEHCRRSWHDDMPPRYTALAARALLEEFVRKGDRSKANEVLDELLAAENVDAGTLLAIHRVAIRRGLERTGEILTRAKREGASPIASALAEAEARVIDDRPAEAISLLDNLDASFDSRIRRLRVRALLSIDEERGVDAMDDWLCSAEADASAAQFVLEQSQSWTDEGLIEQAFTRLASEFGAKSPSVVLARARKTYVFYPHDSVRVARALLDVVELLKRFPSHKEGHEVAAALCLSGDSPAYDRAVEHLQRAIEIDPSDPRAYPRLVRVLQDHGDFDMAEHYLRRLGSLHISDPTTKRIEVDLLQAQGDFEEAAARLSELMRDSATPEQHAKLARLYAGAGNNDKAKQHYRISLDARSVPAELVAEAATFFALIDGIDEGLRSIQAWSGPKDDAERALVLGQFYHKQGLLEDAAAHLELAIAQRPNDPDVLAALAQLHLTEGRFTEAVNRAREALRIDPDREELKSLLAAASLTSVRSDGAEIDSLLTELGESNPAVAETLSLYRSVVSPDGLLAPTAGQLADADDLIARHPRFWPAWRLAVMLYIRSGELETALRLASRASVRLPTRPEPAAMASSLLLDLDRNEDALTAALLWRKHALPDTFDADCFIAALLLDLDRPRAAVRQIEPHAARIQRHHAKYEDQFRVWIASLLRTGDVDRALTWIEPVFHSDPDWITFWLQQALTLDVEHGEAAILAIGDDLITTDPARLELASIWIRFGGMHEDAAALDRASRLLAEVDRGDEQLRMPRLMVRASLAAARGEASEAAECYEAVLQREPNNVVALNNLAQAYIQRGGQCERAVLCAREAVRFLPNHPSTIDTLAQALLCLDDIASIEEAERLITQVLERTPNDPNLLLTRVRVLLKKGETADVRSAIAEAERAIRLMQIPDARLRRELDELRTTTLSGTGSAMR